MTEWRVNREPTTLQQHVFECLTCHESSPPAHAPEDPEAWAIQHAVRHGRGQARHARFARTVSDLWLAQPLRRSAVGAVEVSGGRIFQLIEVTAKGIHTGDLLAVDGLFREVVDLRWVSGRRSRLAFVKGHQTPQLLRLDTRYEIQRPQALQRRLVARREDGR
ncbi:DUF7848 domain-containing protein [Streptomyces sp. 6N223]|uniref:DUF7848 domain-containing protein n=1 Tax=Streptomyces sp. 6N223 TaxID=3457412 RepID=UPI003FD3457B